MSRTPVLSSSSPSRAAVRISLAALLAGALAIALSPIFVRLSAVGPVATAFWRVALALPALSLWLAAERRGTATPRRPKGTPDRLRLIAAGLCFAGDLSLWHWSIHYTSVANATLFANFAPIFVTAVSWLVFGERFTRTFLAGLGCAIAGAMTLMGASLGFGAGHLFGDALGLGTALFYAGYILAVGRLRASFSTATIMTWSGVVTAATLLPLALVLEPTIAPPDAAAWAVLAGLALISHAGGQSLIAYALAHLPAAFSSVSLLLQPAAAGVFAWLLLGEPLTAAQGAGGLIVLCGIFLARLGSR